MISPNLSSQEVVTPQNDNDLSFTTKKVPFHNLASDYSISSESLTTYFPENSDDPYIDVIDFIRTLKGFFNNDIIYYQYVPASNCLTISQQGKKQVISEIQFLWETNKIWVSDFGIFSNITQSSATTNYSSHIQYTNYYSSSEKSVTFNVGAYYFDIYYYQGKCLVPFVIANMLFCSANYYNLVYNGDSYYGVSGEISPWSKDYPTIYTSSKNGTKPSRTMRRSSINAFLFAMDYFYGLKEEKEIKSFNKYINEETMDSFWSEDPDKQHQAFVNFLMKDLDELHTRVDSISVYSSSYKNSVYTEDDYGKFRKEYNSVEKTLREERKDAFPEKLYMVRYQGDTAIITLDSFSVGSNDQIFDSDGNVKDTAWKYDSYYYMQKAMANIRQHSEVHDVLLDLSQNGGGDMSALYRVLGFLTDTVIPHYTYNTLTNEYSCQSMKIDTDGDGLYDDDSYDNYRWTILSSLNTFSAANNLVCKVRQMGIAKVIGQRSGGGMCTILPLVLTDGTAFAISSNNTLRYVKKVNNQITYYSTESGFVPDLEVPYSDFYSDEKLVGYIDEAYQ